MSRGGRHATPVVSMVQVRREGMRSARIHAESIGAPLERADERARSCAWFARRATFFAYVLALGLGVIVFLLHPSASLAGTFTTFGETFQRATSAPVTVTRSFSVWNPSTTYTLRIDNGGFPAGQLCRVSSATIAVNGVSVLRPSDLNQNVAVVERSVSLS